MSQYSHFDLTEFGKPLEKITEDIPDLQGTQVLLEILSSGVCHSDLHIIEGEFDLGEEGVLRMADRGMKLPRTLGHENVGKVIATGPDSDSSLIGQNMLVFPWVGCGSCRPCQEGRTNDCMAMRNIGLVQNGGYATHMLVENANVLVNVDDLEPTLMASHACSGLTVYNALGCLDSSHEDSWLAVMGVGGLGLNAIAIAKAMGFTNIVAVDINDANLTAAREMGATAILNSNTPDAIEQLREITGNALTDVLDTVGVASTVRIAVHAMIKGGRYVVVGLHGGDFKMPQPWLPQKAMTIRGCHVGTIKQLQELVDLVRAGKIKQMPVQIRPMDQVNAALDDLRQGNVTGRIILTNATN